MKKTFAYIIVFLLALSAVSALIVSEGKKGINIIDKNISENVLITGEEVIIDAPVEGDVTAFGGAVSTNYPVSDSLFILGGNVNINSEVGGYLHACGGTVNINSEINGDIISCGGTINFNSEVEGDIRTAGGSISINSPVRGDLIAVSGDLNINSEINGDIAIAGGKVSIGGIIDGNADISAEKIILRKDAVIKGDFIYKAKEIVFSEDQVEGKITAETYKSYNWKPKLMPSFIIYSILSMLVLGLVVVAVAPKTSSRLAESMNKNFWKNMLCGLAALILTPISAVIIAVTVIGIPLAFALFMVYIAAIIVAPVFPALWIGNLILKKKQKSIFKPAGLGLAVIAVLASVPFIGGLVKLLAVLLGLGALGMMIYNSKR